MRVGRWPGRGDNGADVLFSKELAAQSCMQLDEREFGENAVVMCGK
jgi:hypothetical protein